MLGPFATASRRTPPVLHCHSVATVARRQNWSFHCGDVAIFRIFKMATAAMLVFLKSRNFIGYSVQRVETQQYAKFRQNRSIGCEDIKFFRFSRWRPSAILDLFGAHITAKFGYDRCSSFYKPPAHRCPRRRRRQQRQHVTEGTAMAPSNGPNKEIVDSRLLLQCESHNEYFRALSSSN